ncbi:MAG: hypothetical protein JNL63_01045 [Bacteroidia bacterium]|nr:hypothetical protein [Bacteroidia bacterium]
MNLLGLEDGRRKSGVGSREMGGGSQESEDRSWKLGVGAGNQKRENLLVDLHSKFVKKFVGEPLNPGI